ncbi:MAG: alpha/beta fold hydrolase [Lysobacterales bacterium]
MSEPTLGEESEPIQRSDEDLEAALVKRQFIDGQYGQIHLRIAKPPSATHRPLVCLHMSPKSGRIFARFLAAAATDRVVVAPDYPGFGESDPPPASPAVTIEDYAASVWQVVDTLNLGQVDLLGYHTGSEVAAEAARQRPKQVGSIVMISAPVFTPEELADIKHTYQRIPLDEAGTRFEKMWASVMFHRGPGMTLEMAAASFAENLRAGENYEWGHHAAFAYAPRYPKVVASLPHRITVINPGDDLVEMTPRIIPHLANGTVVNHPEWGHGFLDAFTDDAVAEIKSALD